ncbi:hypothetical protein DL771_009841 [Monosporascus sp. 5C6A]|nr:hypothetical protein DL771_009841 [Monosporascus sp. 5C6A]
MSLVLNIVARQDSGKPGLNPPEGITPQFDNPPNRNTEASVGMIICIVVTAFCAFTRGSFLIITRKKPKMEDYLSVASVAIFYSYIGVCFWFMEACGYYVHQWHVRVEDLVEIQYASGPQAQLGNLERV